MRVPVEGGRDLLVAHRRGDVVDRHAIGDQPRRVGIPQVVKPDPARRVPGDVRNGLLGLCELLGLRQTGRAGPLGPHSALVYDAHASKPGVDGSYIFHGSIGGREWDARTGKWKNPNEVFGRYTLKEHKHWYSFSHKHGYLKYWDEVKVVLTGKGITASGRITITGTGIWHV